MGRRLALALSYDGQRYSGWQRQTKPPVPTVQGELEQALSAVADTAIHVQCAGRTDAGVHATHQVVHFDSPFEDPSARPLKAWLRGGNAHLPKDIAIHWVQSVADDFHARFTATARRYRYVICNTATRPAILAKQVTWHRTELNAPLMHEVAQCLVGEHDFSSFRGANCDSRTPMRNVQRAKVVRRGDLVIVDIQANAFLLHMVRNIVGSLLAVGGGEKPPEWFVGVFDARDRTMAGVTAKPDGLYLVDVTYPSAAGLPDSTLGPFFADL